MVSKKVVYRGRVQGVGFRYTAQRLAAGFAVAGFVRNLPGGDVELLAEGEAAEVQAFLEALAGQMAGYIEEQNTREEVPRGLKGFAIRY